MPQNVRLRPQFAPNVTHCERQIQFSGTRSFSLNLKFNSPFLMYGSNACNEVVCAC